jgi:predicted SAM-dependent methyltransferase
VNKLNIGCGHRTIEGYDNVDINSDLPNLTYVAPLDNIPKPDGYYDEVFASHCIEHVSFENGIKALREWYRILKDGGKVIIDTPNIERNIRLYLDGERWENDFYHLTPQEQERLMLNGEPNKTLWLNFKVFSTDHPYDTHYINYDGSLLTDVCKMVGFREASVVQVEPSLIVEAVK